MKLTGNIRYRIEARCFRTPLLVVQVEETGWVTEMVGTWFESSNVTRWRDATTEDMQMQPQVRR